MPTSVGGCGAAILVLACGCTGTIGELGGGDGAAAAIGSTEGEEAPAVRTPESAGYEDGDEALYDRPGPSARIVRLTHSQWHNTVRDLLLLDESVAIDATFRPDPNQQGFMFSGAAGSLSVDDTLFSEYQRAASELAALVTGDPALLDRLLPPDTGDEAERARAFIRVFGERAHRRPLDDALVDEYFALYQSAAGAYSGLGDFDAGIRLVLEAMLQSPYFLYRIESSDRVSGETIPLGPYEVASRLSYMLWDTMPDDSLMAAAASGELVRADIVAREAERMLEDERAGSVIRLFHEQLLELERYSSIGPAPAFYPNAPPTLEDSARQENERFIEYVASEQQGSYRDLLTSTETFVNADLAASYGLSGTFGGGLERVDLDPSERMGLLTQVGFLASHATSVNPDPIHRGVFIAKRILCTHIAAPPDDIPPLPPTEGRTNRETIEDHTQQEGTVCATCHETIINPLGFPFESYDSIGAYRTTDNGHPVDASSTVLIDGQTVAVESALELIAALAESQDVHECYAKHWLEFSYGRPEVAEDRALIERLGTLSAADDASIRELIVGLVKTEAFLTRSTEEPE